MTAPLRWLWLDSVRPQANVCQTRRVGDTIRPVAAVLAPAGQQTDLTGRVVRFKLLRADGSGKVPLTTDNVTVHPLSPFTVDGDRLIADEHELQDGMELLLSSTGTLPGGLAAGLRYWTVGVRAHDFQVSLTRGGPAVSITTTGSGTHSFRIVGSVQYAPQADDVDETGTFAAYFVLDNLGLEHFPVQPRAFRVEINAD